MKQLSNNCQCTPKHVVSTIEALLNAEMTVEIDVLKENLGENIPKSDFQVILKLLLPV